MDLIKKFQHFFSYWYVRYLLATDLYIVEPWEKLVVLTKLKNTIWHDRYFTRVLDLFLAVLFGLVWFFNHSIVVSFIAQLRSSSNWHEVS